MVSSERDWIDVDTYPIDDLGASFTRRLVERCRDELTRSGCCELPGFLRPLTLERIVAETEPLVALGHRSSGPVQPYLEPADPDLPEGHPRRHLGHSALTAIPYDRFPPDHALRRLYEWDPLMRFLAAALMLDRLYRYADPLGGLNVAAMERGDELGWHFDQTDFVTSIALRAAGTGGDFEYAPNVRSASDENYPAVQEVLSGQQKRVRTVAMVPGTLLLFKGRHSIHRVTPITSDPSRLVALLAYDERPGTTSSELLRLARYGRAS